MARSDTERPTDILFCNNFWGRDDAGLDALLNRMRQAKQTCEEVKQFYISRARIEEEYGRQLLRLAKTSVGKDETGTLKDSIDTVRKELEATAKVRINLAQQIRDELEVQLGDFIASQREKRRVQQGIVEKTHRNKQLYTSNVIKAKEKYDSECIKANTLDSQQSSVSGRELERAKMKLQKSQQLVQHADQEYQCALKALEAATDAWNSGWKVACDVFQNLEEERIEFLRNSLWNYANVLSAACVSDDESSERIRVSLEGCEIEKDITTFVREKGTGNEIPDPPKYINFFNGPLDVSGPTVRKANFSSSSPRSIESKPTRTFDRRSESPSPLSSPVKPNALVNGDRNYTPSNRTTSISANTSRSFSTNTEPIDPDTLPDPSTTSILERRAKLYSSPAVVTNGVIRKDRLPDLPAEDPEGEEGTANMEEDDNLIDPRAREVLQIGGNMFDVDTKNQRSAGDDFTSESSEAMYKLPPLEEVKQIINNNHGDRDGSQNNSATWTKRKSIAALLARLDQQANNRRSTTTPDDDKRVAPMVPPKDNYSSAPPTTTPIPATTSSSSTAAVNHTKSNVEDSTWMKRTPSSHSSFDQLGAFPKRIDSPQTESQNRRAMDFRSRTPTQPSEDNTIERMIPRAKSPRPHLQNSAPLAASSTHPTPTELTRKASDEHDISARHSPQPQPQPPSEYATQSRPRNISPYQANGLPPSTSVASATQWSGARAPSPAAAPARSQITRSPSPNIMQRPTSPMQALPQNYPPAPMRGLSPQNGEGYGGTTTANSFGIQLDAHGRLVNGSLAGETQPSFVSAPPPTQALFRSPSPLLPPSDQYAAGRPISAMNRSPSMHSNYSNHHQGPPPQAMGFRQQRASSPASGYALSNGGVGYQRSLSQHPPSLYGAPPPTISRQPSFGGPPGPVAYQRTVSPAPNVYPPRAVSPAPMQYTGPPARQPSPAPPRNNTIPVGQDYTLAGYHTDPSMRRYSNPPMSPMPLQGGEPQRRPSAVFAPPPQAMMRSPSMQMMRSPSHGQLAGNGRPILFWARALYDFNASIPEELSFRRGDVFAVTVEQEDGWWEAEMREDASGPCPPGINGLIPSNFMMRLE
ncbi:uncharacterized protein VTP21DRAFT_3616 [Calcarisporiella thermophila]|uniref:uncharacterized protein n=1 Tax=Calcarisporiella thermophila TaxID=911321 RepID=UPI003742AC9B